MARDKGWDRFFKKRTRNPVIRPSLTNRGGDEQTRDVLTKHFHGESRRVKIELKQLCIFIDETEEDLDEGKDEKAMSAPVIPDDDNDDLDEGEDALDQDICEDVHCPTCRVDEIEEDLDGYLDRECEPLSDYLDEGEIDEDEDDLLNRLFESEPMLDLSSE